MHARFHASGWSAFCRALIGLALVTPVAAQEADWSRLIQRGREEFEDGQYYDAQKTFEQGLGIARKSNPRAAQVSESLILLADTLWKLAEEEKAEPLIREAIGIDESLGEPGRKNLGRDHECLARILLERGKVPEAMTAIQTAESHDQKELGREHVNAIRDMETRARILAKQRPEEAERILRQVVELREVALGRDHLLVGEALSHLVQVLLDTGQHVAAERPYVRARSIILLNYGPDHIDLVPMLLAEARMEDIAGRDSTPIRDHALSIVERVFGPDHIRWARLVVGNAEYQFRFRRFPMAEQMIKEALPIVAARHGERSVEVARIFRGLGLAYSGQGRLAESDEAIRRAIAIEEKLKR